MIIKVQLPSENSPIGVLSKGVGGNVARYLARKIEPKLAAQIPCKKKTVSPDSALWFTEKEEQGYRIQVNALDVARLVSASDTMVAKGNRLAVYRCLRFRLNRMKAMPGDVIAVNRTGVLYTHFGIYIGNGRVIHYAGSDGDFGDICIQEATMDTFLGGSNTYMVIEFPDRNRLSQFNSMIEASLLNAVRHAVRQVDYRVFSPEETIERAKSKLGESKYSLISNNCEHFAMWCKTGMEQSEQVNLLLFGEQGVSVPIQMKV